MSEQFSISGSMTDAAPLSTASSAGSSGAGAGATSPLPLVPEPFFTPPPPHLLHMLMSSDKCQVSDKLKNLYTVLSSDSHWTPEQQTNKV